MNQEQVDSFPQFIKLPQTLFPKFIFIINQMLHIISSPLTSVSPLLSEQYIVVLNKRSLYHKTF